MVWVTWESRNKKVFKSEVTTTSTASDAVKLKVAWWFKFFRKGSFDPITHIILNIKDCCSKAPRDKKKKSDNWISPASNVLRFNVDGSTRGKPGHAGIGGVLRDSRGKILCIFSLYAGSSESNEAELLEIEKAVDLCSSNPLLHSRDIAILSDSKVAVSWINDEGFGCIKHVDTIYGIRSRLEFLRSVVIAFNPRSLNSDADNLAKLGSSLAGDFLYWDIS